MFTYRNCTVNGTTYYSQKVLDVTDLRMTRSYIIGYVHWTWTITTVIIPFILLVFLSGSIIRGLRKVRKNLNRHKRLQIKAEAKATKADIKVSENGENEVLKDVGAVSSATDAISRRETCSTLVNGNSTSAVNGTRSIPSIIINPSPEMVPMEDLAPNSIDTTPEPNGNNLNPSSNSSSKRNSGNEPG